MTTLKQYINYILESHENYFPLTKSRLPSDEVLFLYKKFDDKGQENTKIIIAQLLDEYQLSVQGQLYGEHLNILYNTLCIEKSIDDNVESVSCVEKKKPNLRIIK